MQDKNNETQELPDIQNTRVSSINIDRVGVTRIKFPITLRVKGALQTTFSTINIYGSLPNTKRGTNMSRYLEVLSKQYQQPLNIKKRFRNFLSQLLYTIDTKDVYCEIEFDLFLEKLAPVTKRAGFVSYKCVIAGRLQKGKYTFFNYINKVRVPITSVCPCSKHISKYGAHNQRGYIDITLLYDKDGSLPLESIIRLIEKKGSCEIYPVLKRKDEKYVTEKGYRNAKFVEDICRDTAIALQEIKEIRKFKVKVENFESIHDHNAVAYIYRKRKGSSWVTDDPSFNITV